MGDRRNELFNCLRYILLPPGEDILCRDREADVVSTAGTASPISVGISVGLKRAWATALSAAAERLCLYCREKLPPIFWPDCSSILLPELAYHKRFKNVKDYQSDGEVVCKIRPLVHLP